MPAILAAKQERDFMNINRENNWSGPVLRKHAGFALMAKAEWRENRLKAERARFLDRRERRAKPETEPLLTRWVKSGVFSNHSAGATQTVFSIPSLIFLEWRIRVMIVLTRVKIETVDLADITKLAKYS